MLCAIYGPCGERANRELHDKAVLDVTVQCANGRQSNDVAYIKEIITSVCEKSLCVTAHPHTAISIAVMIRKMDKCHLTCVLTACCMAILDAGLPMTSTFAAVTINPTTLTKKVCGDNICPSVKCSCNSFRKLVVKWCMFWSVKTSNCCLLIVQQ